MGVKINKHLAVSCVQNLIYFYEKVLMEASALYFLFQTWLSYVIVCWWHFLKSHTARYLQKSSGTSFRLIVSYTVCYNKHYSSTLAALQLHYLTLRLLITRAKFTSLIIYYSKLKIAVINSSKIVINTWEQKMDFKPDGWEQQRWEWRTVKCKEATQMSGFDNLRKQAGNTSYRNKHV